MVQVYFLLVLCNVIMGVILSKDFLNKKFENFSPIHQLLASEILQVTIGCIGAIVGILALFLRYTGNIIILGDFIPALLSMISGVTIFIEYIAHEENVESNIIKIVKNIFIKNRVILGFVTFSFGLLHFIIPSIELL